jgi:hypothetical protein
MKRQRSWFIVICTSLVVFFQTGTVYSDVISLYDSGWYKDYISSSWNNQSYLVGSLRDQYRNWFVFDLSNVDMTIGSATLRAYNPIEGYQSPDPTETWSLFDVTSDMTSLMSHNGTSWEDLAIYRDLGGGTNYGSTLVSAEDNGKFIEVTLNSNAITAMNNTLGLFAIGGRLTSLSSTGYQYLFGQTGDNLQVEIVLEAVPEPTTLLLLGLGGLVLRKRRK